MATATQTPNPQETAREPNHSIERKVAGNYLRLAIWANALESGGIGFSIKPTLRYRDDDGNYQNAKNFREIDLLSFAKMFQDADTWCQEYRRRQREAGNGQSAGNSQPAGNEDTPF